ncbi:MAG TPA: hypothetical protein PK863_03960 [Candidatus Dojkabacteria bacterium]|nr:hypothetical protein [Candidatus Dojkabacteria bacterium]HRP51638.1 hypothetical protein [Candidatus Dojkabacteria bacterium]
MTQYENVNGPVLPFDSSTNHTSHHHHLSLEGHEVRARILQTNGNGAEVQIINTPVIILGYTFPDTPTELIVLGAHRGELDTNHPYVQGAIASPPQKPGINYREGGPVVRSQHFIESTAGPFVTLPDNPTFYPNIVITALVELYDEYNKAFRDLVAKNREWETDYQFIIDSEGNPINMMVQIDMTALPQSFLELAESMTPNDVKEIIRGGIFELENSLAMYQLLSKMFPSPNGEPSFFESQFRETLEHMRTISGKKIAIVAVTDPKYDAIKGSEFGKTSDEPLPDDEVYRLTGFDKVFSPQELQTYRQENGNHSDYVFVVRSSDPISKLKDPTSEAPESLLNDADMRRYIKMYSLTLNIDGPDMDLSQMINDTKEYMETIGMGLQINGSEDLNKIYSQRFLREVVLQQIKKFLPSANYYSPILKQQVFDLSGRGFKDVSRSNTDLQDADENFAIHLYEDLERDLLLQLFDQLPISSVFSEQGMKQLSKLGIDLKHGVIKAFGLDLLTHDSNHVSTQSLKQIKQLLETAPSGMLISEVYAHHLALRGIDVPEVENGEKGTRFKPLKRTYGAYGHHTLNFRKVNGLRELLRDIEERGCYVVQPELKNPEAIINGVPTIVIDRNFFSLVGGLPRFMGGFRSAIPTGSREGKKNNVHGNGLTHWLPIYPNLSSDA